MINKDLRNRLPDDEGLFFNLEFVAAKAAIHA